MGFTDVLTTTSSCDNTPRRNILYMLLFPSILKKTNEQLYTIHDAQSGTFPRSACNIKRVLYKTN